MKATQYAEALYNASYGKDDEQCDVLVLNLVGILRRRGHMGLLPKIMREYEKIELVRSTSTSASLRLAREEDRSRFADQIAAYARIMGVTPDDCTTHIDPTVIGGYSVEAKGKRVDRTHKRILLELYRKLITSARYV